MEAIVAGFDAFSGEVSFGAAVYDAFAAAILHTHIEALTGVWRWLLRPSVSRRGLEHVANNLVLHMLGLPQVCGGGDAQAQAIALAEATAQATATAIAEASAKVEVQGAGEACASAAATASCCHKRIENKKRRTTVDKNRNGKEKAVGALTIPRTEARVFPSPRETRKKSMGIRRVTSSSPRLILVMRVDRSLLKSASGASKFISVLDRMSMKVQGKLAGCTSVKTKLFKRLLNVRGVDDPAHTYKNGMEGEFK
eukprot:1161218-Pelagomonas_calceolata.AAC.2